MDHLPRAFGIGWGLLFSQANGYRIIKELMEPDL